MTENLRNRDGTDTRVEVGTSIGHRPPWLEGRSWYHLDHIAVASLPLILVTLSLTGVAFAREGAIQARAIIGTAEVLGPQFLHLAVSELGPIITGLMLAMRVGAGIAAEIGNLNVSEAIIAYRVFGGRPVRDLVLPRIFIGAISCVILVPIGTAVFILAGTVAVWFWFDVPPEEFLFLRSIEPSSLVAAGLKSLGFGAAIPFIAARAGLDAQGGSGAVGASAAKAVVTSTITVLFIDLVISALVTGLAV